MINFKNNKGITLTALIITVVLLIIIAGTAVYTGTDVLEEAKEEVVIQELKMIQNAVNNEHSKMKLASLNDEDGDGAFDYIFNLTWKIGGNLPDNLPIEIQSIIGEGNGYRYFNSNDLNSIGIKGINQSVIINFTTRDVISVNGFNGKYKLSEFGESVNYNSNVIFEIDNVPIPNQFVYLTGNEDEGFVIKNINDGNEFVWVPVKDIDRFARLKEGTTDYRGVLYATKTGNSFNVNINPEDTVYNVNSGLREIDIVTGNDTGTGTNYDGDLSKKTSILESGKYATLLEQFQEEYNEMVKSVMKYGGFYVGRYETNELYGSTKESIPIKNTSWYLMYKNQKELYNEENDSVVSGMIYGSQWDAIINWMKDISNITNSSKLFIKNSIGMGWYSDNYDSGNPSHYTGLDLNEGNNRVKNIYDLAGNYYEWTQEASGNNRRIFRGGLYANSASSGTASSRGHSVPSNKSSSISSRLQLYIK